MIPIHGRQTSSNYERTGLPGFPAILVVLIPMAIQYLMTQAVACMLPISWFNYILDV